MDYDQIRAVLAAFEDEGLEYTIIGAVAPLAAADRLREAWERDNFQSFHARRTRSAG